MKKFIQRSSVLLFVLLGFATTRVQAQIQIGLGGNYLVSAEKGSEFSDGIPGGGLALRYFISPQFAVGLNGRFLTKTYTDDALPGLSIKTQSIVPGLELNYFLTKTGFKPYIGVEGNYFMSKGTASYQGETESFSENNFGVAPKVGIQFMFGSAVGIDINAGYHLILEDSDSKSLLLGAGLVFKLGDK